MSEHEPKADSIEKLDAIAGIRNRPQLFVGNTSDPLVFGRLIAEAACLSFDNLLSGCASHVVVTIESAESVSVFDNGPGIPLASKIGPKSQIESIMTDMFACRAAKSNTSHAKSLCGVGIVCVNALSEKLVYEMAEAGYHWQQEFRKGHKVGPIQAVKPDAGLWQRITFRPDPLLLPVGIPALDVVAEAVSLIAIDADSRTLTIRDDRVGESLTLKLSSMRK